MNSRSKFGQSDYFAQIVASPVSVEPHNVHAEKGVLGTILTNNEAFDRISFLKPEHFSDPLNGRIYDIAAKSICDGRRADWVTLGTYFDNYEPIGPDLTVQQYLRHLPLEATTIRNVGDYGRTVFNLAARRRQITIGMNLVEAAHNSAIETEPERIATDALLALSSTLNQVAASNAFKTLTDIKPSNAAGDCWNGVFGPGEVGALFAISQGGKGFFLTEYCKSHVLGRPVLGRPTRPSAILQVQYEGYGGLEKRVWAAAADLNKQDREVFDRRYAWVTDPPALARGSAGDRGEVMFIEYARRLAQRAGGPVGLITIDTCAKAMAGESLNDDDAVAALFARGRRIAAATGAAVLFVTHPGHSERSRPAGSYQLIGSVDFLIMLTVEVQDRGIAIPHTATRTVVLSKAKDGSSGHVLGSFALRQVEVWKVDDGEPVTSCIVVEAAKSATTEVSAKLTRNQQTMLTILQGSGSIGLTLEQWNEGARAAQIGVKRRADLSEIRLALKRKGLIFEVDPDRWRADITGTYPG